MAKKDKDLVWVEDLRKRMVLPGREAPISRLSVDRLINKWTKVRVKLGAGSAARAYIDKQVAEQVYEYFARKHGIPL